MKKKIIALVLVAALCLTCLSSLGEGAAPAASFNGARLGMSQRQVRWVMGTEPSQIPVGIGGYTALIYQTKVDGFPCVTRFSFLPGDTLYVSRSVFAADGSETRPSFLTERIGRLFGVSERPGDLTAARLAASSAT